MYPTEPNAYAFCADGALGRACGVTITPGGTWITAGTVYDDAHRVLRATAMNLYGEGVVDVNDGAEESHDRVVQMFDMAIMELEN